MPGVKKHLPPYPIPLAKQVLATPLSGSREEAASPQLHMLLCFAGFVWSLSGPGEVVREMDAVVIEYDKGGVSKARGGLDWPTVKKAMTPFWTADLVSARASGHFASSGKAARWA